MKARAASAAALLLLTAAVPAGAGHYAPAACSMQGSAWFSCSLFRAPTCSGDVYSARVDVSSSQPIQNAELIFEGPYFFSFYHRLPLNPRGAAATTFQGCHPYLGWFVTFPFVRRTFEGSSGGADVPSLHAQYDHDYMGC